MTMVQVKLPGEGAVLEINSGDRIIHVRGGEQYSFDMALVGDRVTLVLRHAAESLDRHQGVKNLGGADTFKPVPASEKAGVTEISPAGHEWYRGTGGKGPK